MNRNQWLALAVAGANLALVLLFPPFDFVSLQRGNIPTFGGFHFAPSAAANQVLNRDFLALEVLVILINAAIAWLLLRSRPAKTRRGISRAQRGLLWLVGSNLIAMLLFPPFENYAAITRAALPSFEGFYFVFGDNSQRQIVTAILYIEIALLLINSGLLWLFLKDKGPEQPLTPEQIKALAQRLRAQQNP
ncbi:MAG: hypothetical protein M0P39_08855 [Rhodocyclaceae bacterium]|nr:hypothetical protein [Rhodocyclaceae bacterium]